MPSSFYRELIESSISEIGIHFYEVWLIDTFEAHRVLMLLIKPVRAPTLAHDHTCV